MSCAIPWRVESPTKMAVDIWPTTVTVLCAALVITFLIVYPKTKDKSWLLKHKSNYYMSILDKPSKKKQRDDNDMKALTPECSLWPC